jgi:non-lysosomal glucosylceramidase
MRAGRAILDGLLWNGEYYVQQVIPPTASTESPGVGVGAPGSLQAGDRDPRYQFGPGCLSDHLLGQWFARVVGLGDLLPGEHVRAAVAAIYRHNFRQDLSSHHSVQRVYAINDEAGLLLCTWPRGGRPSYPFPYADEVWTGIEYQVAAHLIYEGLVEEGLRLVAAVRARHDGAKRNPWNEFECGHHYARAMSSWSLLLALSGCHYSAPRRTISFSPRICQHAFRSFFSAGSAWGEFSQTVQGQRYRASLAVEWGELILERLGLPVLDGETAVTGPSGAERALATGGVVSLGRPVRLRAGERIEIEGEAAPVR